mmetsp:Transcript_52617/g.169834  ORF Transcript_52617/g.169834 Transcript_52617/m.169834 type:complete len:229 (+) Transcript_52617:1324-2010(+)
MACNTCANCETALCCPTHPRSSMCRVCAEVSPKKASDILGELEFTPQQVVLLARRQQHTERHDVGEGRTISHISKYFQRDCPCRARKTRQHRRVVSGDVGPQAHLCTCSIQERRGRGPLTALLACADGRVHGHNIGHTLPNWHGIEEGDGQLPLEALLEGTDQRVARHDRGRHATGLHVSQHGDCLLPLVAFLTCADRSIVRDGSRLDCYVWHVSQQVECTLPPVAFL